MKEKLLYRLILVAIFAYITYSMFFADGGGRLELGPPASDIPKPVPLYPAPEITASTLDGKEIRLSNYLGKPVVLTFWAPWCSACRRELPTLDSLAGKLGDDAEVLTISTMYRDPVNVRSTVKSRNMEFATIALDQKDVSAQAYQVSVLPTSLIIDPHGIVRYRIDGARGWGRPQAIQDVRNIASIGPQGIPENEGAH